MILVIVFTIPAPFLPGDNFQSHMLKRGVGKNECLGGLEEFLQQFFVWGALHISYTLDFNFVQVIVQDLLLKGLLKVMTSLEDVTRCYLQCTYIKKEKIRLFLTGLFSLI